MSSIQYRGRLAPSPTGYLHIGHARTFWTAHQRAVDAQGVLVLRSEDIDAVRAKMAFAEAMFEDLRWVGLRWQEGPDCGGPYGPYEQSKRRSFYQAAFEQLQQAGCVYPCRCTRKDVLRALQAPHVSDEGPIYPGTCRPNATVRVSNEIPKAPAASKLNWRFRVPDGETIEFVDGFFGHRRFIAGKDFGDFVVWRHDDLPSYQLSVVVDDAAMRVTEVVRGADLLLSTARQLLLYRALGCSPPAFYHCPLVTDEAGVRLAKRHDSLSLRTLRQQGISPKMVRERMQAAMIRNQIQ
ncbi:MAG TPA: tRNA glutamyl-Q(34) synthetase GluQRS [Verrucomicrobiae bacterium]|nr:tRNA glutamyl-Q(34) synthetase GluQRS [Verrucomicrobiae bacterium]